MNEIQGKGKVLILLFDPHSLRFLLMPLSLSLFSNLVERTSIQTFSPPPLLLLLLIKTIYIFFNFLVAELQLLMATLCVQIGHVIWSLDFAWDLLKSLTSVVQLEVRVRVPSSFVERERGRKVCERVTRRHRRCRASGFTWETDGCEPKLLLLSFFFSLRCWSDSHLGLRNSALSNSLKMSREVKVRMAWRKGWTPEFIVWLHSTALGRSPGPSNLLPSVTQPVIKTRRSSSSFASFSSAPHYSVLSLFSPIKKTGRRRTL